MRLAEDKMTILSDLLKKEDFGEKAACNPPSVLPI
jgi:hypothetical protein